MAKSEKENLFEYNEASIKSLDWREHIRLRPGMYIGKLGDGSSKDDGIYVLVKEVMDNCIDEHMMGYGRTIDVKITEAKVVVRDYGRGIPLGKVVDVVSKINTGAKYDSGAFQKSVGLNGVGTKAVNALSNYFKVQAFREGQTKLAEFKNIESLGPMADPVLQRTIENSLSRPFDNESSIGLLFVFRKQARNARFEDVVETVRSEWRKDKLAKHVEAIRAKALRP